MVTAVRCCGMAVAHGRAGVGNDVAKSRVDASGCRVHSARWQSPAICNHSTGHLSSIDISLGMGKRRLDAAGTELWRVLIGLVSSYGRSGSVDPGDRCRCRFWRVIMSLSGRT